MSYAYDQYLAEHIGNVNKGLHWMLDNLHLDPETKPAIEEAMLHSHDESKFSTEEYDAYDKYFYGGNRSYKVVQDFNYAWLHHIHQNPHHWQYWVLLEDDPESGMPYKALEIPVPYIFEMIADWWSFSWKSGNLFEIFNWYADHRSKQIINLKSREIVEYILEKIWKVLIMQETVAGHDISEIEGQYKRFWIEEQLFKGYSFVPSGKVPDNVTMYYDPTPDISLIQHDDGENGDIFGSKYTKRFEDELLKHSSAQVIGKVVGTRETENGLEVTVEHSEPEDDEDLYGVPELKKFPMPDKKHVKSAIRFFNYVDPKYEKELAEAIIEKAKEFGLDLENDISVGDENRFKNYIPEDVLEHTGLKGMKWGIRRFQNYDGSLTEEGKARYGRPSKPVHYGNKNDPRFKQTVFVSGSSKTQNEDSQYYRKELPKAIREELDRYVKDGDTILVGDAPGIDRQVQDYLNGKNYDNVEVYGPGKNVRYSANEKWKTNPIDDPDHEEGSTEWLAKKDEAMAKRASDGIAIILDEGAKATRKNIGRLADLDKNISVFQLDKNGPDLDRWFDESELLDIMDTEVSKLYQ